MDGAARGLWIVCAAACLAVLGASAQPATAPVQGARLAVSVVTIGPGDAAFERFGHNCIVVRDIESGQSVAFNYGVFDFNTRHFYFNFIQKKLDYLCVAYEAAPMLDDYRSHDRDIWEQQLNLSPEQNLALLQFLENNIREPNNTYRYDYYLDNCSTRVRDAVDSVIQGAIRSQLRDLGTDRTFRDYTRIAMQSNFFIYTALQAIEGHPIDRRITALEETFLPEKLMQRLDSIRIPDGAGGDKPLVARTTRLHTSKRPPLPGVARNWLWIYAGIALAIAGAIAGTAAATARFARAFALCLTIAWWLLSAFGGWLIVYCGLFTDHRVVWPNENILQLSPVALLAPLLLRNTRWSSALSSVLAAMSLLGVALKLLPGFSQPNWEIIVLALPINCAIAFVMIRRYNSARTLTEQNMSHRTPLLWAALFLAILIGCESGPKPQKITPMPAQPPQPPPRQDMPIDPVLREQAKLIVLEATRSNNPVVRANAIEGVQDGLGMEGKEQILAGLTDQSSVVRFAAAMACGTVRIEDAQPALIRLLNDPDRSVQAAAVYALHRLGDKRFSHHLEETATDIKPGVRANTAMIFGRLGEPTALRPLSAMTTDVDAVVRWQVAESQWRLGSDTGLQTLVAGTLSQFPDDQMICVLALVGPKDSRVSEHIRGKLMSDYPEISLIASRALGVLGSDAGYAVALGYSQNADPRLKCLSAFALGAIGRTDCQLVLATMMKDPNPSVRLAAATAMLQLKPPQ